MSHHETSPKTSSWPAHVLRSLGMWLVHLVAGTALLVVMLSLVPRFFEICVAQDWNVPVLVILIVDESRIFSYYLWFLMPFFAILDLVLLLVLNLGRQWMRWAAGIWHNVLIVAILINIMLAYMGSTIVYDEYLARADAEEME